MAFVVRLAVLGEHRSWCTSRTTRGGSLELVPLDLTLETVVLASVSEFGDLRSYAMVSQASSGMHRQLSASITVVRNLEGNGFPSSSTPLGLCFWCSGFGDDLGYAHGSKWFSCDLCQELVCEHCVVLASFGGDGVQPTSWVCARHRQEVDSVCTVEPVRWWLFELVDARMQYVYMDYDFEFFFQIIALSGEVVRNDQDRPCAVLKSSWKSSFCRVWAAVHHGTGGRQLCALVFGDISINNRTRYDGFQWSPAALEGFRWSRYMQRSDARACSEDSPLCVLVVLGAF